MAITERRRNMRAEHCRACGKLCEPGQGYLYRDTKSRTRSRLGRFGWFVKCEECHGGSKTRLTVRLEKLAADRANKPVVRPWSVAQVKKWTVSRTTHEGDVAIRVEACGVFSEIVSYRHRIHSQFSAPTGYSLEQEQFAGKPLSERAAAYLSPKILQIVMEVQHEERMAGELAAAKLTAAGAITTYNPFGYCWKVDYRGGRYTLWGCVGGANRVSGTSRPNETGCWVETTVEELLAASA